MFKEITSISKNYALVKLVGNINEDILNFNVIFDEPNKKKRAKKHGFFSRIKGKVLNSRRAKKRKKLCA